MAELPRTPRSSPITIYVDGDDDGKPMYLALSAEGQAPAQQGPLQHMFEAQSFEVGLSLHQ